MGKRKESICVLMMSLMIGVAFGNKSLTFVYDKNGNLQEVYQDEKHISSYQYNVLNQLYLISKNQSPLSLSTYHYYPDGQRSNKENLLEKNKIYFYYGQTGKLINESLTSDGTKVKNVSYFMGSRFIKNVHNKNNSTLQIALAVRENNPISIKLSQGLSDKVSVQLDGYGLQSDGNGTQSQLNNKEALIELSFNNNPFIYGAGYYDGESGLNFQKARYYDPKDARFISQDNRDLVNRYNYANSNPVMSYDPSGHNALRAIRDYTVGSTKGQWIGNAATIGMDIGVSFVTAGVALPLLQGALIGMVVGAGGAAITADIDNHWKYWQQGASQVATMAIVGGLIGGGNIFLHSRFAPKQEMIESTDSLYAEQAKEYLESRLAQAEKKVSELQAQLEDTNASNDILNQQLGVSDARLKEAQEDAANAKENWNFWTNSAKEEKRQKEALASALETERGNRELLERQLKEAKTPRPAVTALASLNEDQMAKMFSDHAQMNKARDLQAKQIGNQITIGQALDLLN